MKELTARLDALRGDAEPQSLDARAISAIVGNPGCGRRNLLDAAGIDKEALARAIRHPMYAQPSRMVLARGAQFEAQVKANGGAQLLTLLRQDIGLSIPEAEHEDLKTIGGNEGKLARYRNTVQRLTAVARSAQDGGTLFDHPYLKITVAGYDVFLEPDLVAVKSGGKFYIVEVKSFSVIDGQAPAAAVEGAELQAAVYIYALRELLRSHGFDEDLVADEAIFVCPQNFINKPFAARVNVRNQITAVRRILKRMHDLDTILSNLPAGLTFALRGPAGFRPAEELMAGLRLVPARYAPSCLDTCEMARFCRLEEQGSTAVLGRQVREELALDTIGEVVGLARGTRLPGPDQVEQAELLRRAQRYRDELLGSMA
ncbi:hypothetical protein [Micromonospora sp. MA102]|uniref:hypothetical protein n=1 Tax=Micromonospora sp. MA102 TaxID=2952755 RepID=UPI0021C60956|nr:hypothetical protein [Micromonospora sp. MA102]